MAEWWSFGRLTFAIFVTILTIGYCDRTSDKIYIDIDGSISCFRRLNATHQIGCASHRSGNVGVLHVVNTTNDLDDALRGPNDPYVLVILPILFNRMFLSKMRDSGKVNGVLLVYLEASNEYISEFSPDQSCPNSKYGMYRDNLSSSDCSEQWNRPWGNGELFEDWGFPIFLLKKETDVKNVYECYSKFNSPESGKAHRWPFCAAELKSTMLAAKDSKTCMRRSSMVTNLNPYNVCDPLGDFNIWSTLQPTNKSSPIADRSLIVVAARMDATSMFENFSPGAVTTVTGLVTFLAVAQALSQYKNLTNNIMFVLFNGESFDYIGSSRMVYDMERGVFPSVIKDDIVDQPAPMNLSNINYFVELSQLSHLAEDESIWFHTDPDSSDIQNGQITKLTDELLLQSHNLGLNLKRANESLPLPPASLQSFLWKDKDISGIVLADHETKYTNRFYNSIFDVWSVLKYNNGTEGKPPLENHLARIASVVAGSVYYIAGGKSGQTIDVNVTLISELLNCYLENASCKYFTITAEPSANLQKMSEVPQSLYVSVDVNLNPFSSFTIKLLSYFMGEQLEMKESDCHNNHPGNIFRYFWMRGTNETNPGICTKAPIHFSRAVSPAFVIDGYDYSSNMYSTWTESVWENTSVRIFLKPGRQWEAIVLVIGILIFGLSLLAVWSIRRNSTILFSRGQVGC